MLWFDPGMGKTAITLDALCKVNEWPALIVAPMRVCQTVWAQEAQKWDQFRHLKFVFLHGTKKDKLLGALLSGESDAHIYLVNPEGIAWLAENLQNVADFPFKTVVFDEITKFKNAQSERVKKLLGRDKRGGFGRNLLEHVRRRWGLTGSPAANGLLDLFGQFLVVDDGAALGRYYSHFRDTYFQPSYNGFEWKPQQGAELRIEERITPYVLRMDADDYLQLPALVEDLRYVELPPEAKKLYDNMERDSVIDVPTKPSLNALTKDQFTEIMGANAGAVYSKLKQLTHGAVYDDKHKWFQVHDAKIKALSDLVEELGAQQLLLAYEFQHDAERIQTWWKERHLGDAESFQPIPVLRSGMSDGATAQIVADWNAGRIPILMAHPASAGHGLNLQGSGACHIAWLSPPWDFELYDQFIRRVRRQGSEAARVINHIFLVKGTIDVLCLADKRDKMLAQDRLMDALGSDKQETTMAGLPESTGATHVQPKGWGLPAANPEKAAQQEAQAAKITPPAVQQTTVGGAFAAAFAGKNGAAEAPSVTVLAMPSPPSAPTGPAQTFEEHRAQLAQKVETVNAATAEVAPKRTRKVAEVPTPSAPQWGRLDAVDPPGAGPAKKCHTTRRAERAPTPTTQSRA